MAESWMLGFVFVVSVLVSTADKVSEFNYVIGTQAIYGTSWASYNFSKDDTLTENVRGIVEMGGNQLKLRLADDACEAYRMKGCANITSLKAAMQLPGFANAFSHPKLKYYQTWLYSYSCARDRIADWTEADSELEYKEVKEWAVYMLEKFSGTGKVFMAGEWESDWVLLGTSGNCKLPNGKWNMQCDIRPEAIELFVKWATVRQRAITDARNEANHYNVSLFYYIEFNHGPQALAGRPGIGNSVIPRVNPDLTSYSSYTATNAFATNLSNVPKVEAVFDAVMNHVLGKLSPKSLPSLDALGFQHRAFIGEYGPGAKQDMASATRFTARVCHAAMKWGAPFALYWEFYYNNGASPTVAIIPRSGQKTPIWHLFNDYFSRAHAYVKTYAQQHDGSVPSAATFSKWGAAYFAPKQRGSCELRPNVTFTSDGYEAPARTAEECWEYCDENPVCLAGVFDGVCHVKYSTLVSSTGPGVACVKTTPVEAGSEIAAPSSIFV